MGYGDRPKLVAEAHSSHTNQLRPLRAVIGSMSGIVDVRLCLKCGQRQASSYQTAVLYIISSILPLSSMRQS